MPTPTDIPFELARTALENALRGFTLLEETQQNVVQMQLKAIDRALSGAQETMTEVSRASDWTALGTLPSLMVRHAVEQNTSMMQHCLKLIADTQSAWISGARDASESLQRCQADAIASSASSGTGFPMQAMFNQVNEATEAMTAGARAASANAQAAMQGAARAGRRNDHAS